MSNSDIRNSACLDGWNESISTRDWDVKHCSIPPPLLFWKWYLDQFITDGNAVRSCLSEI